MVLAVCCLSVLLVSLDTTILSVALPSIQEDLHSSVSGLQWTLDAYTIVLASLLILAGSTADRVGRRRIFLLGLVLFTGGSALCSFAPSLDWLIVFRMAQATGGCMLTPVAMAILANAFPQPRERARAIGVWGGVVGISMAAGPIVGGALVQTAGWQSVFWLNVPIGLAALLLTAYGFSGMPEGMTTGPDGSVYVLGQKLIRLKSDRTVSAPAFTAPENAISSGAVALPDGSVVLGQSGQVKEIGPTGDVSVLAGAVGAARATGAAVAGSAAAAGFHFSTTPSPFGVGPDGAVLIADQDVLWSLENGTLKRLYRISAKAADGLPLQLGPDSAVDVSGTAYLSPAERSPEVPGLLGDPLAVSASGLLSRPLLPAQIAGLPGSPAAFNVRWLTGDGANGVFAQVYDPSGNNGAVLHLHSGKADLIAHENPGIDPDKPCRIQHPVNALRLPCPLPEAMTYRSGSLILGGVQDYVLQIRLA